ncbi:MAG: NAD(P)/FAD-dependent oxidoreductase [Actinomycetia bacterium]|nr:NAD(P)/FAD-dependent oxidoreductase [Actinomycetes bacterium]MCP4086878.1 NAD(P)/FAD-dependent oxidoreductase [Actinomycetes bacterium]
MDGSGDIRVIVIGAGMSGILSAVKLRERGITDVVIYEKADRLGGTWRENTYPGIACDVPSHAYCYSFALNPNWSQHFAPGDEIQAYFEGVAREFEVDGLIRFGQEIVRAEWADGAWTVETSDGATDRAQILIGATGVLHHPSYPDIPGLDSFAGASFHSARWDHSVELEGKRVGVIGTGSTAVQITSALIDVVDRFSLFQRTAQWVLPVPNPGYTDEERAAYTADPDGLRILHDDLGQRMTNLVATALIDSESPAMARIEEQCRENLSQVVDPELRMKLSPDYRAACKRLIMSPDFYEKVQSPNLDLVTAGLERIEPTGVRTSDGVLHEIDVLVLATGFQVDRFLRPMEVVGVNGQTLDEAWTPRPLAYLAISVPGFPNLFMLNGPNGPVGNFSLIEIAERQFEYIAQLIDEVRAGRCEGLAPNAGATEAYEQSRVEAAKQTIWMTGCRSWYLDDRGIPATWPWTFDRFRDEMAAPKLEAFDRF